MRNRRVGEHVIFVATLAAGGLFAWLTAPPLMYAAFLGMMVGSIGSLVASEYGKWRDHAH